MQTRKSMTGREKIMQKRQKNQPAAGTGRLEGLKRSMRLLRAGFFFCAAEENPLDALV